jgi:hypothetical protein
MLNTSKVVLPASTEHRSCAPTSPTDILSKWSSRRPRFASPVKGRGLLGSCGLVICSSWARAASPRHVRLQLPERSSLHRLGACRNPRQRKARSASCSALFAMHSSEMCVAPTCGLHCGGSSHKGPGMISGISGAPSRGDTTGLWGTLLCPGNPFKFVGSQLVGLSKKLVATTLSADNTNAFYVEVLVLLLNLAVRQPPSIQCEAQSMQSGTSILRLLCRPAECKKAAIYISAHQMAGHPCHASRKFSCKLVTI